ncbi:hypothetical protein [Paenibacillus polymyxa]|uniref:hypothetical protein n=1 Tax=Paenibacillus polymyxa TaxID=1406 RepID=UPI003EBC6B86
MNLRLSRMTPIISGIQRGGDARVLPGCLAPTSGQMSVPHASGSSCGPNAE